MVLNTDLLAIVLVVYFAGHAWILLGTAPDVVRVVTGVSAAIAAVLILLSILD